MKANMPEIWPQWAVQNWLIIGTALGAMEANMPEVWPQWAVVT